MVVIFYLGAGCLHCLEQLQSFAREAEAFQAQGITVIGVSTEDRNTLKTNLDTYGGDGFPFTLLAGSDLVAFHNVGAFDSLHQMPLHGTFLIDARGRLLFSDIGPEPFNEPQFLLEEANRLGLSSAPVPIQTASP